MYLLRHYEINNIRGNMFNFYRLKYKLILTNRGCRDILFLLHDFYVLYLLLYSSSCKFNINYIMLKMIFLAFLFIYFFFIVIASEISVRRECYSVTYKH